jgi:ADP-heptose:LPS heptosyltransferase
VTDPYPRERATRRRGARTITSRPRVDARAAVRPRAIFVGFNALGDTLCTTPAVRAYRRLHPDAHISYIAQSAPFTRVLDANPDIDLLLYSEHLSRYGLTRFSMEWLYQQPLDFSEPATMYLFDMNQVCTTKEAFEEHIAIGLSKLVQIPIDSRRPVVHVTNDERITAGKIASGRYAVVSMHSNSNPKRTDGQGRVKDWPAERFEAVCRHLRSRGIDDIVAVGSEFDERRSSPMWRDLYGLPIKIVAALLQDASLVVTLENGLGHLAHAVDAPAVMIYSNVVPIGWAYPVEASCCEVLYDDPSRIPAAAVIAAAQRVMQRADRRRPEQALRVML